LWDKTVWLFGSNHSFVILGMAFIGGMVNVGSDVVFVPYMRNFEDVYLPAYFIGSGLSAVFPSLISIIQGASSYDCVFDSNANQTFPHYLKPNFSSTTFYLIMFAWSLLACFSFYLLNWHKKRIESWYPFSRLTVNSQDPITAQRQSKLLNIDASRQRDCLILLCLAILGIEINTILPSLLSYVTLP
jgi:riboflavin transporter 2